MLNKGALQQCDTPETVYNLPANRFVATTIGSPPTNFITADVRVHGDDLLLAHPAFALAAEGGRHPVPRRARSRRARTGATPAGEGPDRLPARRRPRLRRRRQTDARSPRRCRWSNPSAAKPSSICIVGGDLVKAVVPPTQRFEERRHVWLGFDPERTHLFDRAHRAAHLHDWAGRAVRLSGGRSLSDCAS